MKLVKEQFLFNVFTAQRKLAIPLSVFAPLASVHCLYPHVNIKYDNVATYSRWPT